MYPQPWPRIAEIMFLKFDGFVREDWYCAGTGAGNGSGADFPNGSRLEWWRFMEVVIATRK